jgi:hypothetical protein
VTSTGTACGLPLVEGTSRGDLARCPDAWEDRSTVYQGVPMFSTARSALFLLLVGCGTAAPDPAPPAADGTATQVAPREAVASVVIMEMHDGCACTKGRQLASRAEFDAALAKLAVKPPVTVVYYDTEVEKAQPYWDMAQPVAMPGYYLLDASGGLVEMLQGQILQADFTGALGAR